ncbi:unknown [Prevotella sp. CAG:755]|nr:unknown [Prevotella sp. CAG:755]
MLRGFYAMPRAHVGSSGTATDKTTRYATGISGFAPAFYRLCARNRYSVTTRQRTPAPSKQTALCL